MIIGLHMKLKSLKKLMLFSFVWLLFANLCPVHALDEYSPETEKLTDAEDLELTAGKSFVLECDEKVVRVAVGDPKIADVRPLNREKVLINAIEPGTTNLIVWYNDDTTDVYDLTVKYDIAEIKKKLKEMVPGADVRVSMSFKVLLVDGYVDDQETMDRVLRVLQAFVGRDYIRNLLVLKGPQQVQLEARIVEISRSDIKRYGLGFLLDVQHNGKQIGIGGLLPPGTDRNSDTDLSGTGGIGVAEDGSTSLLNSFQMTSSYLLSTPFVNAFQIAFHMLDDNISGLLSLLKSQGLATIMAQPTLVAMSGQEASFHVGGTFPVPVTGSYGSTGFEDQEYGVELEFTPTVTGKETIHLVVTTSVSDIDYSTSVTSGGATVPGIVNREASSTLQLKDGQTFAIAGLLKESINSVVNKVPFFGDIPIIGTIFRSKEYLKEETELIILVTPRLVKAMNKNEIPPLPGEMNDFNQNDFEFFLLDRMWKKKRSNSEKIPRFSGPTGFGN